jgi:hypothetical protein
MKFAKTTLLTGHESRNDESIDNKKEIKMVHPIFGMMGF